MKIIVDTNIIFSGLLNTSGKIGDLLFNSQGIFEFYSCAYMRLEIEKHWEKLKRNSKLTDSQLRESQFKLLGEINFINEQLIPAKTWLLAEKITPDIDADDSDFIALTHHLKGNLGQAVKTFITDLKRKNSKKYLPPPNFLN